MRSLATRRATFAHACFVMFCAIACAKTTTPDPVGGETHFLVSCGDEQACGLGLDCVCGVCTRACISDNSCATLASTATCEAAGTPIGSCADPVASPVCDVTCDGSDDCSVLGTGFTCTQGSCRKLSDNACVYEGVILALDTSIDDGCNTCTCEASGVECTARACIDGGNDGGAMDGGDGGPMDGGIDGAPAGSCVLDDVRYDDGEDLTLDCNACQCSAGSIDCTAAYCFVCPDRDVDAGATRLTVIPPVDLDCDLSAIPGAQVLAKTTDIVGFMALAEEHVHWFEVNDPSPLRVHKDPSVDTSVEFYQGASDTIAAAAFDACQFYFAQPAFDAFGIDVGITPADSEDYTTLSRNAGDTGPFAVSRRPDMLLDGLHVYFTGRGALFRVRRTGGPTIRLATLGEPSVMGGDEIADVGDRIYWLHNDDSVTTSADEIRYIDKTYPHATGMLTTGLANPFWMERRGSHLYVANRGTRDALDNHRHDASIVRVALSDGAKTTVSATGDFIVKVAGDDTHVYWIDGTNATAVIYRAPLDGSASASVVLNAAPNANGSIEVDGTHIYWTASCGNGTAIVRMPKP